VAPEGLKNFRRKRSLKLTQNKNKKIQQVLLIFPPRTMASTPKFLQRMQQRSPGGTAVDTRNPPMHNRGASMTQSRSPGGIGFLSKQYQAVVSQNPGTPTRSPPTPPAPVRLVEMPTVGAGSTNTASIHKYIQAHRSVLASRRSDGAQKQWCNDYERLLSETHNVASLLSISEQGKQLAETKAGLLEGSENRVSELTKEEDVMALEISRLNGLVAKLKAEERSKLTKEEDALALEIGHLKGHVAKLEAEVRSKTTLLADEAQRNENLRDERNEARKAELMAVDNEATKAECEKLAARIASLEADNAVLLAEKSQWLNQLENENQQLQELFEDARAAKDVMVRELNAIDEERTRLTEDRERLEKVMKNSQNEMAKLSIKKSEPVQEMNLPELLTFKTFDTMGQAKLKFYKLQERLRRRQEKMTAVFDAGSALVQYYRSIGDDGAANSLLASLVDRSLHCDMAVVQDAVSKNIDVHGGQDYGMSDPDVKKVWESLDECLAAQSSTMDRGCDDMVTMFITAYNEVQRGSKSGTMGTINDIYSELMSNALESGGSPLNVGEDVEYEQHVLDRVLISLHLSSSPLNNSAVDGVVHEAALKQHRLLAAKHELLQRNHKHLTKRAKAAGI